MFVTGLKRVWPAQTTCEGPAWEADGLLDPVDYVIDLQANVVGMGLSPDHRCGGKEMLEE